MTIFYKINLPPASGYLVSLLLKRGGKLNALSGTNAYIVRLKRKEYVFMGEFTPLMPYMYGIVFSNQKYWFEILKDLKVRFAWESRKSQKKVLFLITKDGFYNALEEKMAMVRGDGKNNIKNLVRNENLKRINSKDKALMPIRIVDRQTRLGRIPERGEEVHFAGVSDYTDITRSLDKHFVSEAKRIIDFLPGIVFLRFEAFVKNPGRIDKFTLGKVSVSPGVNIFSKLTDGKKWKDTGNFLCYKMSLGV